MEGKQGGQPLGRGQELDRYSIVVHSHLKWDWVWQRPQQFLSRLSRKHRVLFVEVPDAQDDVHVTHIDLREVTDFPNINVFQIKIPANRGSDTAWISTSHSQRPRKAQVELLLQNFCFSGGCVAGNKST